MGIIPFDPAKILPGGMQVLLCFKDQEIASLESLKDLPKVTPKNSLNKFKDYVSHYLIYL